MLAGALVLAVLATVGIVYYFNRDDDTVAGRSSDQREQSDDAGEGSDRGNSVSDREPWTIEEMAGWTRSETAWLTDNALVHVTDAFVVAHDRQTSEELWQIPVPELEDAESGVRYCGASSDVVDDRAVLAYGPVDDSDVTTCRFVQVLDVAGGTELWTAQVAEASEFGSLPAGDFGVDLFADTVVAAYTDVNSQAVVVGLDAGAGTELWRTSSSKELFGANACSIHDLGAADEEALVVATCAGDTVNTDLGLARVNPADGSVSQRGRIKQADVGREIGGPSLLGTDPMMVRLTDFSAWPLIDYLITIDPATLAVDTVILPDEGRALVATPSGDDGRVTPIVVVNPEAGWVAVATLPVLADDVPSDEPSGADTEVVAYDLATGEPRWVAQSEQVLRAPLAIDSGELLVWAEPTERGEPVGLLRLDVETGEVVGSIEPFPLLDNFHLGHSSFGPEARFLVAEDWLYAVRTAPAPSVATVLAIPR